MLLEKKLSSARATYRAGSPASRAPGDTENEDGRGELFRALPSVDELLLSPGVEDLLRQHGRQALVEATRSVLAQIRSEIEGGQHGRNGLDERVGALAESIRKELDNTLRYSVRPVINATGVVLHTNLGRAPLSRAALDHVVEVAEGYCNLEMDIESGERSRRDVHAESLLLRVLSMKSGLAGAASMDRGVVVVNNCAAATFLALNALAEGKEVVVSRGELVEIGGGFRIPDILAKSGARLREVGTTNKTRIADYESAITSETALILRVHQSNFSMEGFTEQPSLRDLMAVSRRRGVPLFHDQGTGLLASLDRHGLYGQETLADSFRQGCDVIAASGDKLLGGPQCGLLIGRKDQIERIRQNPLLRAFRVDKLTYAALEATLLDYLTGREESIPATRMLNTAAAEIEARCKVVAAQVNSPRLSVEAVPVMSLIGGGTAPGAQLSSWAIALRHETMDAATLHRSLRRCDPPILGRISDSAVLLDLRTVEPGFDDLIAASLQRLARDL